MRWDEFYVGDPVETGHGSLYEVAARRGDYVMWADVQLDAKARSPRPTVVGVSVRRERRIRSTERSKSGKAPLIRLTTTSPEAVSVRAIRRLPLETFLEAAREAVATRELPTDERWARIERARPPRRQGRRWTDQEWERLADSYRREVAKGTPNPGAALAHRMGESPETMRVWVHRMRKRGLLEGWEG